MRGWESNIRNETTLSIPRWSALSGIWSSVCSVCSNSARRHENLNWCFKNAYRFTERKTYIVLDGSAYRLRRTYGIKCILCFAEKKWEDCLEHLGGCGNRTSGSLFEMKLMWGFGKTPETRYSFLPTNFWTPWKKPNSTQKENKPRGGAHLALAGSDWAAAASWWGALLSHWFDCLRLCNIYIWLGNTNTTTWICQCSVEASNPSKRKFWRRRVHPFWIPQASSKTQHLEICISRNKHATPAVVWLPKKKQKICIAKFTKFQKDQWDMRWTENY